MNKKQLIIEAAIKVFARDGLEKGKIADIAKEAGIGKANHIWMHIFNRST